MDFPRIFQTGSRSLTGDVDAANSRGETSSSGTNPPNKGVYTETFASTAFDAFGINVSVAAVLSANNDRLVDISIGATSSEQVIVADLCVSNISDTQIYHAFLPLKIPAGSRLTHRSGVSASNNQLTPVGMSLFGGGFVGHHASCGRCQTLGAVSGDAGGTPVDPGVTAGTKGAWSDVPAATTTAFQGRWLGIGIANQANALRAVANWLLDVRIGTADTHVVIENLHLHSEASNSIYPGFIGPIPLAIPAGSQLAARASCSITDPTDRTFDIIFYVFG